MTSWTARPREERALLNPAFCAALLWRAANARVRAESRPLSFEEAFLLLPLVLASSTRESLPARLTTALPIWLDRYPIQQRHLVVRSRALVPFTRAAILFGSLNGCLRVHAGCIQASTEWSAAIKRFERTASAEVKQCAQRAAFVSKWFANAGDAATVFALMGVRP